MDDLREIYQIRDRGVGTVEEQWRRNIDLFRGRLVGSTIILDSPDYDELKEIKVVATAPSDLLECVFVIYWKENNENKSCKITKECNISFKN